MSNLDTIELILQTVGDKMEVCYNSKGEADLKQFTKVLNSTHSVEI